MDKTYCLAIEALEKQRQRIAFDANMQKRFKINTPYAIKCAEEYDRLTAAITELENEAATEDIQEVQSVLLENVYKQFVDDGQLPLF